MTTVRYNPFSLEYELVDTLTGLVLESGYEDLQAAKQVAHVYNTDEE